MLLALPDMVGDDIVDADADGDATGAGAADGTLAFPTSVGGILFRIFANSPRLPETKSRPTEGVKILAWMRLGSRPQKKLAHTSGVSKIMAEH